MIRICALAALLCLPACSESKTKGEAAQASRSPTAPEPGAAPSPTTKPAQAQAPADASPAQSGPIPAQAKQLLVSTTEGWEGTQTHLHRFERGPDGNWSPVGTPFPSVIGRTGLAWGRGVHDIQAAEGEPIKAEGDGKSPAGVFSLGSAYGYDESFGGGASELPYQQTSAPWRCVNDAKSKHYNRVVDESQVDKDWNESEKMRRRDQLYRLVVEINHNHLVPESLAPAPGAGSCIFFHVWRIEDSPTIGCTAMSMADMQSLIAWLDPAKAPHLVALPSARYADLRERWQLPALP